MNEITLENIATEVHAVKVDLIALRNDIVEILGQTKEVTDFIKQLETVVEAMSDNPMLKAMGMGGIAKPGDLPRLPGMG
jgi:predicted component of type VI protein secretion system